MAFALAGLRGRPTGESRVPIGSNVHDGGTRALCIRYIGELADEKWPAIKVPAAHQPLIDLIRIHVSAGMVDGTV